MVCKIALPSVDLPQPDSPTSPRVSPEYTLKLNDLQKRSDIVVFGKNGGPLLIVECKATTVKIDDETLFQIAQYNFELQVPYLMMSNGLNHVYGQLNSEKEGIKYLEHFPQLDLNN